MTFNSRGSATMWFPPSSKTIRQHNNGMESLHFRALAEAFANFSIIFFFEGIKERNIF